MSCLTNFFNKAALPLSVLLLLNLWGCARYKTELIVYLPLLNEKAAAGQAETPLHKDFLIAVLPVENLSGTSAPLEEIGNSIRAGLAGSGFRILDKETLEQFRRQHRMRYIGGVSAVLSEAMLKETGADAVLITSLEAYREADPPQISLIARLVSSGPQPEIIWIDSIGLSGDESPGLLDLKLIRESRQLLEKAVASLTDSLIDGVHPEMHDQHGDTQPSLPVQAGETDKLLPAAHSLNRKYLPYDYFRSPLIEQGRKYSAAVLPMLDLAIRKNVGIIAQLHYVRELFNLTDFKVVEPGLVREGLLRIRAVMPQGPSLAETDLITGKELLGVDLVFSGKVFDYQNTSLNPKVDFSVQAIEKNSRKVVFGARTFSTGLDGVFFYNYGRVYTAHNLLQEMSRVTVQLLTVPYRRPEMQEEFIAQFLLRESGRSQPDYVTIAHDGRN